MDRFWWKLPVLRGLTPLRRGFVEIFALCGFGTLTLCPFLIQFKPVMPAETFDTVAQVGATLLVAYAVETSWWLKSSRVRGHKRENWVGYASGIGACGLTGVGFALVLSTSATSLSGIETIGLAWTSFTVALLGGLVATLPLLIYEWTHHLQADYLDE